MWQIFLQGKERRVILSLSPLRALEEAKSQGSLHCNFSLPYLCITSLAMEWVLCQQSYHWVYSWHCCCTLVASQVLVWPKYDLSSMPEWPIFCPVSEYVLVYLELICYLFGFLLFGGFSLFDHLGCSPLMQLLGELSERPNSWHPHNPHV